MKNGNKMSKNIVTAIASIIIVVVLIVGYNIRVGTAVAMETVPFARETIPEKTEITAGMLDTTRIPKSALKGNIVRNMNEIVPPDGKTKFYTRVNTVIPKGSLIYKDTVVEEENLPDASLYKLEDGEKLNYITVNMLSSYSNSIKPGQYIDIYADAKINDETKVAKMFKNIKILAVKTSNGLNVFEKTNEKRVPYVIFFGLKNEEDMLIKKIHAINEWGGGATKDGSIRASHITLTPIPTNATDLDLGEKIDTKVTGGELMKDIDELARDMTDE